MSTQVQAHDVYRTLMVDAKLRLLATERVLAAAAPVTGLAALDVEFCFLQLRKVVELVAFSSMKREEGRYRLLRAQNPQGPRDAGDATTDWQAQDILKRLVTLSPHALPIPLSGSKETKPGLTGFVRANLAVDHGRIIELYKRCGGFMHSKNPLTPDFIASVEAERNKYAEAPEHVRRGAKFLRDMLWKHAVVQLDWSDPDDPKVMDGPSSAWLIDFGTSDDLFVTMVLAEAT